MPLVEDLSSIAVTFGEGTEFQAEVYSVWLDDGMWDSSISFEDDRFSPYDKDAPLRLRYPTPRAGNGALAVVRAEAHWNTLVGIFKSIMCDK